MRFAYVLGAVLLASIAAPVLGQELDTRHYIYIEASGTTSLPAEFALVTATARNKAATPETAVESSNKTMSELIAALEKSGVKSSDIQTGSFGFEAVYIKPELYQTRDCQLLRPTRSGSRQIRRLSRH